MLGLGFGLEGHGLDFGLAARGLGLATQGLGLQLEAYRFVVCKTSAKDKTALYNDSYARNDIR